MKTYLLEITQGEKDAMKGILAEWEVFIKDAISANMEIGDVKSVRELEGELKQTQAVLWKVVGAVHITIESLA